MKQILFNALPGKSGFSNYFNLPWVLPGTILQLLSESHIKVDFGKLFESFINYIELAMFELKPAEKDNAPLEFRR